MAYLAFAGLTKRYGTVEAVSNLDLEVRQGEAMALLGPSGCGKTTTLRMLAGLIAPTAGTISVAGTDVTKLPAHKRNMGYVFQSYALFPHMSVADNIAFGLVERGADRTARAKAVADILRLVRLEGYDTRRPRELSGGQQQRVALARALVVRPDVLLLDESLSNLDSKLREDMRQEIRDIQRSLGITTLFVTHDQVEALTMCDRIAVMDRGRVAQVGTPRDIYDAPANRFVANFVGRANALPVERDGAGALTAGGQPIRAPEGPATGPLDLFVRPQLLSLLFGAEPVPDGMNRLPGRIARTIFVGDRLDVVVETAAGRLTVELPAHVDTPLAGRDATIVWRPEDGRLFPREAAP